MRFLHVEAPYLGPFKDLDLGEELVVDAGSGVSPERLFRARESPSPLTHLVASAEGSTSGGVIPQWAVEICAR